MLLSNKYRILFANLFQKHALTFDRSRSKTVPFRLDESAKIVDRDEAVMFFLILISLQTDQISSVIFV